MRRLVKNILNSTVDFHDLLKLFIFNSIGVKSIKHESVYIAGWYLTVFSLSLAINGLNTELNIFSVCFFIFSLAQTGILVFIGFKFGKRGERSEYDQIPGKRERGETQ